MRWLLTLGLVLKSCSIIFCQAPNAFIHYTIEQGLSDNNVVDMVQDDVGFMWIATQNGLNRFDGVQFKTFFKNENNFDLPNNIITRIRKWRDHLLIIATRNGLGILNTQTGHCQAVMIPSQKEISQQTNFIECLQVTSNDEIVVGTHTGVYVYNRQLQMIAKTEAGYKPEDVGRRRFIFILGIALLNNGDFIAETAYGVQFYNHQRRIFSPLTGHANSVYRAAGLYLLRYPHHIFDIDRFNRLICINYREPRNQITVFDLTSGKITRSLCPCQNENDFNWSSKIAFHNDTLFSVNAINGGFYLFTYHPEMLEVSVNPVKILPGVFSNKLMLDSENRWWACTVNGLFSQSLIKQQFRNTSVTGYFDNKEMLEGVMAIYRYKKKLYVGLESIHGGIVVFDEKDQFIRKIDLSSLHPGCNMTWNIDRWGEDTLVVGTQAGVVLLNTNNYHFSRINYGGWPTAANEAPITLSYTDRHGTRWIGLGNTNGVMAFYPKTRTWKHFSSTDKSATFKLRYPLHIAEDKNGDVWMGHDEEGRFMRWSYRRQDFETVVRRFNSPKENFANSLTSDREGNLWLYQEDQGLLQWDPVKNTLKKYPFQGY